MKVNDLVVCIGDFEKIWYDKLVAKPIVGQVYTIKSIEDDYLYLAEISRKHHFKLEFPFLGDLDYECWAKECFEVIKYDKDEIESCLNKEISQVG